jgi:glycine betaine/proline transport system permease protein
MSDFPQFLYFPIAPHINRLMDIILIKFGTFFDSVTAGILWMLMAIESFLLWLPWWLFVAVVVCLGWRNTRSLGTSAVMGLLLIMVGCFGLWDLMMQTLAIVGVAVIISVILGIPAGIVMSSNSTVDAVLKPVLDAMQTMPSFVYLVPALMFFGLGKVPGIFATIIYSMPPMIRLTNLGIRQVPGDVVEAGEAFGATTMQLLLKIKLPLAYQSIMSGVNQTTMMALAMVVIASMIGARGLGEQVLLAIGRIDVGRGLEAGLSIVALAIVIDRILQGIGRRQSPPPG